MNNSLFKLLKSKCMHWNLNQSAVKTNYVNRFGSFYNRIICCGCVNNLKTQIFSPAVITKFETTFTNPKKIPTLYLTKIETILFPAKKMHHLEINLKCTPLNTTIRFFRKSVTNFCIWNFCDNIYICKCSYFVKPAPNGTAVNNCTASASEETPVTTKRGETWNELGKFWSGEWMVSFRCVLLNRHSIRHQPEEDSLFRKTIRYTILDKRQCFAWMMNDMGTVSFLLLTETIR